MVCSAEKQGVVQEIRQDGVVVRMSVSDACAACREKGCTLQRGRSSDVFVPCSPQAYAVGDGVSLTLSRTHAFRALWCAYLLPLVLMMVALAVVSACTGNEVLSGVAALLVLLPYYLVLWLLRERMGRTFQLEIARKE